MATNRYSLAQRVLHWVIALLVVPVLAVGITLGLLGFEGTKAAFGSDATNALYTYHKTFGILILGLMAVRIAVRLRRGAPAYETPLTGFERVASRLVHVLLYAVLLVMPVLGWLATAAGGYPVQFFGWNLPGLIGKDKALSETLFWLHGLGGGVLAGLIALHVAGALRHWLVKRDGVMARMGLFR